jgi:hypothetical protein
MPLELARRIVDEVASESFSQKHTVTRFEVGENGDAFLNKDFVPILRYIRKQLPHVKIEFFTNFQHFTKDKSSIFLCERLIDNLICNIDGGSSADYFAAKRIPYERVKEHIVDFLQLRKELKMAVPLTMQILTADYYIKTVQQNLGADPLRLIGPEKQCSSNARNIRSIKAEWQGILDPGQDRIAPSTSIFAWAERAGVDTTKLNYDNYSCPLLRRVKEEAFIAPDGSWYACCYDSNYELALGNVGEETIDTIFCSETRRQLIHMLERKEFVEIGGPCKTVNCCQSISYTSGQRQIKKAMKSALKPLGTLVRALGGRP